MSLNKTTNISANKTNTVYVGIDRIESKDTDISGGFAIIKSVALKNGNVQVSERNYDPNGNRFCDAYVAPDEIFFDQEDSVTTLYGDYSAERVRLRSADDNNKTTVTKDSIEVTDGTNTTYQTATVVSADSATEATTMSATGVTFDDGTASSKMSVIKRTMDAAGTTPITLQRGMYLAIVSHTNNTSAGQQGLYVIQAYDTNSVILTIAAAANSTLTISGLTLTWATTNTYRALRLIYLS